MAVAWQWVVGPEDAGKRLDQVLASRVPGASRAKARALVADGKVRVDGRRRKKGELLALGARIEVSELPRPADFDATPDASLDLSVVLELPELVVVDKAAGVASHPLSPEETGTVVNALVARYPEMAGVGWRRREPGIVHRLDTDTSGLILAARTAPAFDSLREAQRAGLVEKRYVALCTGAVRAPQTIELALANDPRDPRRVVADVGLPVRARFREAVTEVVSARRVGEGHSLVEVLLRSGFRHQVRVHLAAKGHPLAGDVRYDGWPIEGLGRHFLHASALAFPHPTTGETVEVRSELPEHLTRALTTLASG